MNGTAKTLVCMSGKNPGNGEMRQRTQPWPDMPHTTPIQEKLLSASYERQQMRAAQSGCKCRR